MAVSATEKRLCRVREGAYIGGVCTGIAEYFDVDTIVVRILAVLLTFVSFGIVGIVYLAMWARLPLELEKPAPYDVTPESAESSAFGCVDCLPGIAGDVAHDSAGGLPLLARLAVAVGLMLVFLLVSVNVSPMLPGTQWWQFWPIIGLMTGICLIIIPIRTRFEAMWHSWGVVLTSISASLLPMALGMVSWATIPCAFQQFWFVLVLGLVLIGVGAYRNIDVLTLAGAFFIVAFCIMGLTLCVVPGELETFWLRMPSGRSFVIALGWH